MFSRNRSMVHGLLCRLSIAPGRDREGAVCHGRIRHYFLLHVGHKFPHELFRLGPSLRTLDQFIIGRYFGHTDSCWLVYVHDHGHECWRQWVGHTDEFDRLWHAAGFDGFHDFRVFRTGSSPRHVRWCGNGQCDLHARWRGISGMLAFRDLAPFHQHWLLRSDGDKGRR